MTQDEIFAHLLADMLLQQITDGIGVKHLQADAIDLAKTWKAVMTELESPSVRNTPSASDEPQ